MKTIALISAITMTTLSGCATSQLRDYDSLNTATVNCANKEAQLEYARSQIPTGTERAVNALGASVWREFYSKMQGEEKSRQQLINQNYYESAARDLINRIESQCP